MVTLGYGLFSEEHNAPKLVHLAQRAEEAGFPFATISDHYHPWLDSQGESPFVWGTLGAIAAATERLVVGTTVTCPIERIHPAIVAQAAATASSLMPDRFFLGIGSGENLNEHVCGGRWPSAAVRIEQMEEAIDIIRKLWTGKLTSYRSRHFEVDRARIYSLPERLPPIYVAASGDKSVGVAARAGDGLISVAPNDELIKSYQDQGGRGPHIGLLTLCWAETEQQGRDILRKHWPNTALKGSLGQELAQPSDFEAAVAQIRDEDLSFVPCGPDPEPVREMIQRYDDAGYDFVSFHQVGPDQEGFFRFWEEHLARHYPQDRTPIAISGEGEQRRAAS